MKKKIVDKSNISFESYKAKLRVFPAFANLPLEEFERVAKEKFDLKYGSTFIPNPSEPINIEIITNEVGAWINKSEAEFALNLYNKYIDSNNITNVSDLDLLKALVSFEVQIRRIQEYLNKTAIESQKQNKCPEVPINELKTLGELTSKIVDFKRLLGLASDKVKDDPLKEWQLWLKKMVIWSKELNQVSKYKECPHCGKPLLFLLRPECYDVMKHSFFRDKVLANAHLWKLYKSGTITLLDVCKVLLGEQCLDDSYGHWLEHKIFIQENIDPLMESLDRESDGT
jgi:hypothetical protein